MPNLESIKTNLILDKFAQVDLRSSTLIFTLKNKKKDYFNDFGKAISIIKNYIVNLLHLFLKKKTIFKM